MYLTFSIYIRFYFKHYTKQLNTGLGTEYGKLHVYIVERGSPGKTTEVKEGGKVFHPSGNTGILKNFFTFLFRKSIDFKLIELLISNFLNKIHSPQVFI